MYGHNKQMILSCPSYIIPGTWWENIQHIEENLPAISNVELLFFMYDDETKRLLAPEEEKILSYEGRLTLTVHLPDPLYSEHEELIEKTSPLANYWIIHPPEEGEEPAFTAMINSWRSRYGNRFLLENLIGRNHFWFVHQTEWPLCLDTGHALRRGHSPLQYFLRWKKRIKEIHLHDIHQNKDHSPLSADSIWLKDFIPALSEYTGILTIELFKETELRSSLQVLKQLK